MWVVASTSSAGYLDVRCAIVRFTYVDTATSAVGGTWYIGIYHMPKHSTTLEELLVVMAIT